MIVQNPPTHAFRTFLAANTHFWSERLRRSPPRGSGYVLVDLLHNNGSVLLLNLLLARYIAEYLGIDVAAFAAPMFTNHPVPVEEVRQLARSFGVTNIVHVDRAPGDRSSDGSVLAGIRDFVRLASQRARLSKLRGQLQKLSGSSLRKELLRLDIAGIPIGDLIYDSYLDVARKATIEKYDEKVGETLTRALRFCDDFDSLFASGEIRALIVSHSVYVDYGIPLRLSLKHGIPVFGKVWLDPIGVRRYDRPEESAEFAGMPVKPALKYFRRRLGPTLRKRADDFFPPTPNKAMGLDYFRFGYGSDKTEHAKQELIELLGIEPSKKTCLIMAQQFTDSPHCYPDMLFDDYFQWLDETLAFVATQDQVNWLVRQHPYEFVVNETEYFDDLARRHIYGQSRIRLVPNSVTTSSLFDCVDAVTTVIGSGGIEFASVGVPCILAGNTFYGDFDFAIRPRTKEAYFSALANVPQLARLSERQIADAKELALVFLTYKRVSSNRVPYITDLSGRTITQDDLDRYWIDAARLVEEKQPEDDPLYRNVRKMLEEKHITLLDFEVE
jgi:hypothetical protein